MFSAFLGSSAEKTPKQIPNVVEVLRIAVLVARGSIEITRDDARSDSCSFVKSLPMQRLLRSMVLLNDTNVSLEISLVFPRFFVSVYYYTVHL